MSVDESALGRATTESRTRATHRRDQLEPLLRIERRQEDAARRAGCPRPARPGAPSPPPCRGHPTGATGRVCDPEGGAGALHRAASRPMLGPPEVARCSRRPPSSARIGPSDDAPGLPGPGRRRAGRPAHRPPPGVLLGPDASSSSAACVGALDQVVAESLDPPRLPAAGSDGMRGPPAAPLLSAPAPASRPVRPGRPACPSQAPARRLWWLHRPRAGCVRPFRRRPAGGVWGSAAAQHGSRHQRQGAER